MHRSIVVLAVCAAFAALASGASAQPTGCCARTTRGLGGALQPTQPAPQAPSDLGTEPTCRVITIAGSDDFCRQTRTYLEALRATRTGARLLSALERAAKSVVIFKGTSDRCWVDGVRLEDALAEGRVVDGRFLVTRAGKGVASRVEFSLVGDGCYPSVMNLGHELIHALHNATGTGTFNVDYSAIERGTKSHEEARTIGLGAYAKDPITDNALRLEVVVPALPRRATHTAECPAPAPAASPRLADGEPDAHLKPTYRIGEPLRVGVSVKFAEATAFRLGIRVLDPMGLEVGDPEVIEVEETTGVGTTFEVRLPGQLLLGTYRVVVGVQRGWLGKMRTKSFPFEMVP